MKFSWFPSVKSQRGLVCTSQQFWNIADSPQTKEVCDQIVACEDADERGKLKKQLSVVTWQAFFPGRRLNQEAEHSGLFMLDIDHMDIMPFEFYEKRVCNRKEELGIMLVHMTPSCAGLRIVAKCRPEFNTLVECQKWLAEQLDTEFDEACKDFARSSYLPHSSYMFYVNGNIFTEEPADGTVYKNDVVAELEKLGLQGAVIEIEKQKKNSEIDQREGLFGGEDTYNGVQLSEIAKAWLRENGGEVVQGERNTRLYQLALRMRYITDFNAATLVRVMPDFGLPADEMKSLCLHACNASRGQHIPLDLVKITERLAKEEALNEDDLELPDIITDTTKLPPLPPIFRQWAEIAPDDFKAACVLCQLPILGALGSRLRSEYLDGKLHSPSFQVSLEAPQASGKSFLTRLCEYELAQMMEHDNNERQKERDYDNKIKEMKLLNIKVDKKNKEEILGERPETLVRYVPATISITKLLMRMHNAKGLHLFALSEEIDTITKAFKKGFSDFSDLLRVSFDNGLYGQDYATENSFSGTIRLFYNLLASGTPKALRRFYTDPEDGLVSRVLFVSLPDQFGKTLPVWKEFDKEQKQIVDINLVRLNEITLQGDEVQDEHIMKLQFLNKDLQAWLIRQQQEALRENNRTRDIFCRRAAVVGFRAGMLAWFLYGEKNTPTIRKNVSSFAIWVANSMLNQHLMRFDVKGTQSNTIPWEEAFERVPETFSREVAERILRSAGCESSIRLVMYKWKLHGLIEEVERKGKTNITYRKTGRK